MKKYIITVLFLLIITFVSNADDFYAECITYPDSNHTYLWPSEVSTKFSRDTPELKKSIDILRNLGFVRSYIIIHKNQLVLEEYFGQAKASDSENIHSASKTMISALTGIAIEKGYISNTSQKISDFLPSDYFKGKNSKNGDITIKDLLTMRSGLKWTEDYTEYSIAKSSNWIKQIISNSQSKGRGKIFNYSSGDTHLLAAVLTEATGMPLKLFAEENLFNKLDINIEFWKQDPNLIYSGGFNFFITPMEMASFGQLYLNGGDGDGSQLVNKKWIRDSFKYSVSFSKESDGHGYCWWLNRVGSYQVKTAWGFAGQMIHVIPGLDLVIVATTNSEKTSAQNNEDYTFPILKKYIIPLFSD